MHSLLSTLQSFFIRHKFILFAVAILFSAALVATLTQLTKEVKREMTFTPSPFVVPTTSGLLRTSPFTTRQYNLPTIYPTLDLQSPQSRYPFDTTALSLGYKIGNTTIYLQDLEKRFVLYFPDALSSRSNGENWRKIADLVSADAIILSEAVDEGVLQPKDAVGINPMKVNIAREHFTKKGTSYISGEMVTVWFYNTKPPAMGIDVAKTKTRTVIEGLHDDVISGRLTMKQASEKITFMYELAEIDFAYQTNAYVKFEYAKPGQIVIHDPLVNKLLFTTAHGQVSEILTGRDKGSDWYDAYYTFLKITEKKQAEFDTIEAMIETRMQEGMKIIL